MITVVFSQTDVSGNFFDITVMNIAIEKTI